ncbi:MAG: hypothetical protein ABEK01_05745 [Candidatus Nanohaloarchaea archaeon]
MDDEDLQLLYGLRDKFDEITHKRRDSQPQYRHVYTFQGGVSEDVPSGREGTIDIDGYDEVPEYTLDQVRGKPLLRMTHSFEEIERALSGNGF